MNWSSPIKNTSQVPDSVALYRKVLASQEDHSVVISSIGLLTNLAALLQSGPDVYSSFTGHALVASKVRLLAVMGGKYPSSGTSAECNLCGCYHNADSMSKATAARASAYVFDNWPAGVKWL